MLDLSLSLLPGVLALVFILSSVLYFIIFRVNKGEVPKTPTRVVVPTEVTISSEWGGKCSDGPTEVTIIPHGSDGRALPGEVNLLQNFLTKAECERIITAAEEEGFGITPYPKHYRGNLRLTVNDPGLAEVFFYRIKSWVPPVISLDGSEWQIVGLNERIRLSKYLKGDEFKTHIDAKAIRTSDEQSMFTVNIYLNSDFGGGRTIFYDKDRTTELTSVQPEAGVCLLFRQPPGAYLAHSGEVLKSGVKYLIRSDVMYRRAKFLD